MDVHFPAGVPDVDQGIGQNKGANFAMHDTSVEHTDSKATYLWVWAALLLLTAVEVVLSYKQVLTPVHMLEVLLILSVIKAGLITMYFMHLKGELPRMRWLLTISVMACFALMWIFFFRDADRILTLGVK
jgi:caa(3)-type oxidase subunit IV